MMQRRTVAVTREGILLDGQPFYLLSGCVHYFRYPQAEWRPLLEQARWAGLNTIDTVIPWNRHEPTPGTFDFSAEADIGAYLDLCAELGLYAIVRPGPYICAEWENGGIPAWLSGRSDVQLRVDDPAFLEATLRWFDTLLPILAQRQITNGGGTVILCQIENEHWASGVYGSDLHQTTMARAAEERGIEVPQYTCMGAMPGRPEFRNGWSGIAEKLVQTRELWPENPMIVSELWSGWFDNWGTSHNSKKSPEQLDITLHRLAAVGASGFSHWMWAGGTNFGYWGGRTVGGDSIHMTTSYDYDAPVTEDGALTDKALIARRHHLFLGTLGAELAPVLADAVAGGPRVIAPAAVRGRSEGGSAPYRNVRAGANAPAAWRDFTATYLQNLTFEGQNYQLFLKNPSRHLLIEVEAGSLKPVFTNLPLGEHWLLRYHTGRILGFWRGEQHDTLVLYGFLGEVSSAEIVERAEGAQDRRVVQRSTQIRTAEVDGALQLQYWVAEQPVEALLTAGDHQLRVVILSEEQANSWEPPQHAASNATLTTHNSQLVTRNSTLPIVPHTVVEFSADEGWQPLETPQALEQLGCDLGYGWYRLRFSANEERETTLAAPWLSDRARVYLDGQEVGVLGVQPGGALLAIPVQVSAGDHELLVLADNLGRFNYGSNLGERKGLLDTLYWGGKQESISKGWIALWQEAVFAGEAIAQARPDAVRADIENVDLSNFAFEGPSVWLLRTIAARPGMRHVIELTGDRNPGAFFVNGVAIERFSRHRSGGLIRADITPYLREGENVLALNINGYAGVAWSATLLTFDPAQAVDGAWSFRGGVNAGARSERAGDSGPLFYRAVFSRKDLPDGSLLRLRPDGLFKGQIWLNGQNCGRFWQIGPQETYKLPLSWVQDEGENELLIFAEEGSSEAVTLVVG
jgi:beta-galactosidase